MFCFNVKKGIPVCHVVILVTILSATTTKAAAYNHILSTMWSVQSYTRTVAPEFKLFTKTREYKNIIANHQLFSFQFKKSYT